MEALGKAFLEAFNEACGKAFDLGAGRKREAEEERQAHRRAAGNG
jgi:hypothetical protein